MSLHSHLESELCNGPFVDIHKSFLLFNTLYFQGKLASVEVKWSNRMTLCAGLCCYNSGGYCVIKLSQKILQYRTNKEVIETLLHEMIHAYLFVTHNNRDRDGHGPGFIRLMDLINHKGGYNISVFHSFRDEVEMYRTHWWECNKCKNVVKRSMNRKPGPYDYWFPRHQRNCGGDYIKIKEPEKKVSTKKESKKNERELVETEAKTKKQKRQDNENAPSKKLISNETDFQPVIIYDPKPEKKAKDPVNSAVTIDLDVSDLEELTFQRLLWTEYSKDKNDSLLGFSKHDPIVLDD